jgi:hypothetical protein
VWSEVYRRSTLFTAILLSLLPLNPSHHKAQSKKAQSEAPNWVIAGDERFTIEAKADDPANTTQDQLHKMLQALLEYRSTQVPPRE